jgi:hypothetical protein
MCPSGATCLPADICFNKACCSMTKRTSSHQHVTCSSLTPVVCRRAHVLFTLFVGGLMSYLRYLYEGSCLIYVVCRRAHVLFTLFVGGLMSYLRYLCLFTYSGVQHILCCVFVWFCSSCVPCMST